MAEGPQHFIGLKNGSLISSCVSEPAFTASLLDFVRSHNKKVIQLSPTLTWDQVCDFAEKCTKREDLVLHITTSHPGAFMFAVAMNCAATTDIIFYRERYCCTGPPCAIGGFRQVARLFADDFEEEDCPICFEPFQIANNCEQCGQSICRKCFSASGKGKEKVSCPFCRKALSI